MRLFLKGTLATAVLGTLLAVSSAAPASAQVARPLTALGITTGSDMVTQVQNRRGWRGGRVNRGGRNVNRGFRGGGRVVNRGWCGGGRNYRRGPGIGLGLGLATGAIIGGAIAAQGRAGNADAYCASRFQSYDPSSGTYLGYDGLRHACP